MSRTKGITVAEVLVAAFLLALFIGILTRFFQSASRISGEELERNSAEALLLSVTTKLRSDLATATPAGLSLTTGGDTLLIHPIILSDTGSVVYQNRLTLWTHSTSENLLRRARTDTYSGFTFDGTAFRADPTELAGLPASSEFSNVGRFEGISSFQLTTNPEVDPPLIGSPLSLELSVRLNRVEKELQLSEIIHLRNSGS